MMSGRAKNARILTRLLGILLVIPPAAGYSRPPGEKAPTVRPPSYKDQKFLYLYSADTDWRQEWAPVIHRAARNLTKPEQLREQGSSSTAAESVSAVMIETRGFRIQLANVMEESEANQIRTQAIPFFKDVYVTYISPTYRVRAGNFLTRMEAQRAVDLAKSNGFTAAWVVPSKIEISDNREHP